MSLENTITEIITPPLRDLGFVLVQVRVMGGYNPTIQIMIERMDETLTTVDDCAEVSHAISALLDVEDPIVNAYTLEVSTAGIDRPLVRLRDFERYQGMLVRLEVLSPAAGRRKIRGFIKEVSDGVITLKPDTLATDEPNHGILVAHENIKWAKLVLTDALIAHSKQLYKLSDV